MQGLEVPLVIQGRLVGRGRGNWLLGREPAPLPTTLCSLSSSSCGRAGSRGGGGRLMVARRGVVAGAMHSGSCSSKATLGRGGHRERPSSNLSHALKPSSLRITSVPIFRPTQCFRFLGCRVPSRGG